MQKCAKGLFVVSIFSGTTVFAEIQGVIDACVKLSGMPDLTLSFMVSAVFYTTWRYSYRELHYLDDV